MTGADTVREMVERDIERNGRMASTMARAGLLSDILEQHAELYEALEKVRDACLFTEDGPSGDYTAITEEPHIDEFLFVEICNALNKARGDA